MKKFNSTISFSLLLTAFGHVFIVKHSSYGIQTYSIGLIMVAIFYSLRYAYKDKSIKDTLKVIMVITYTLIALLSILNYNNLTLIIVLLILSGLNWLLLEIIDVIKAKKFKTPVNYFLWIGITLMALSVGLKLFHLPFNSASEFFGLSFSSLGFIREYRFYPKLKK